MRQIIRTKRSGQILGCILCLLGFLALLVVFWKAWPNLSGSSDVLSSLWSQVLHEEIRVGSMLTLKLIYITVGGSGLLILGMLVLALSRQIFYVSAQTTLQCPYCRNQWTARRAMGWAECPFCRKFIQPHVVKKI
jgi:hypothetical protein